MANESNIAKKLVANTKYLYTDQILGIYGTMVQNYGCDIVESMVQLKHAIEEHFFDGIEPEWESMDACNWWETLCSKYVQISCDTVMGVDRLNFVWKNGCKPPKQLIV